ncbi:hypothetical protein [Guillardia theta]|uniref:RING-type E3 ubiquitin transferase n=1 Tax=Guillardia theta TaxID=55529 RepID=Q9AW07_GUITH|nr:hypothetical protein GTHECHR2167 [Guillardia theta]CAC27064.1 hypothetical protein [Guillardia theta]|mmetsp:Transcript_18747/g.61575  ORF Transcript_18747/g.61575 Transcript_18747/m.61575 type:complete len:478 (+) Transcript_18747:4756-6189(+)
MLQLVIKIFYNICTFIANIALILKCFMASNEAKLYSFLRLLSHHGIMRFSFSVLLIKYLSKNFVSILLKIFEQSDQVKNATLFETILKFSKNKILTQSIKNSIMECIIILLFCSRKFTFYSTFIFFVATIFKTIHEPILEKFYDNYEIIFNWFENEGIFLFNFSLLISLESFFISYFDTRTIPRIVNILTGPEIYQISYYVRGNYIFSLINYFIKCKKNNVVDTFILISYLKLLTNILSIGIFILNLNCIAVTNRSVFKYFAIRRTFICIKILIDINQEIVRYRKTKYSIQNLLNSPTMDDMNFQNDKLCIICRDEFNFEDSKILSCKHIYHIKCLQTWLIRQYCCPICLAPISTKSKKLQTIINDKSSNRGCVLFLKFIKRVLKIKKFSGSSVFNKFNKFYQISHNSLFEFFKNHNNKITLIEKKQIYKYFRKILNLNQFYQNQKRKLSKIFQAVTESEYNTSKDTNFRYFDLWSR